MYRIKIDPQSKYGRYFRPAAAILVIVVAVLFAIREIVADDRDNLTIVALLAAAAVGGVAFLSGRR